MSVIMAEINSSTCSVWLNAGNSSICFNFASYLITTSFGINMILSLPLHCYILWLSVKEMIRGRSTEIFVVNASLVEVIFCFDFVFVLRMYLFKCADCKSPVVLLGVVLFVGRPLFLTCMCVERYLGVLHPLIFLKLKPMKYRIACSAVGWIVIISSCVICDMYVVHYKFILPVFLVFFSVTLYTCLMVLKALSRPGERDAVHQDKLKAFQIIRLVLVCTSLTYVPGMASLVLYYIVKYETFVLVWSAFLCFGIMTGFLQPLLYLRKLGKLSFFTIKGRVTFETQ